MIRSRSGLQLSLSNGARLVKCMISVVPETVGIKMNMQKLISARRPGANRGNPLVDEKQGTGRSGDTWGRPMSIRRRLSADMMGYNPYDCNRWRSVDSAMGPEDTLSSMHVGFV